MESIQLTNQAPELGMKNMSMGRLIAIGILGLVLWYVIYKQLEPFSYFFSYSLLGLEKSGHLGGAIQFFVYDTPKVMMLLTLIVFDPLTAKETAAAALKFINEQLGKRPVAAVVYSHSHGDHFGGVLSVVDEKDVRRGKVPIIAPVGFMDHAVAENVYAGNAMTSRMFYQYGVLLPCGPFGHVDQAIGKNTAAGNLGLIEPSVIIDQDFKEMTVDGVKMIFQNTPGTEAPAEMNTYFPDLKAFWDAD